MATKHFDPVIFSDLHKDAYGFRPRFSTDGMTDAELDDLWLRTIADQERAMDDEARMEREAQRELESAIASVQAVAGSRRDAIRWLVQAEDLEPQEIEHFLWKWGVAFSLAETYRAEAA